MQQMIDKKCQNNLNPPNINVLMNVVLNDYANKCVQFCFYSHAVNPSYTSLIKFKIYKRLILDNIFYNSDIQSKLFDIFSCSQQINNAFSRLVRKYKLKRATIKNKEDLGMEPIEEGTRNVIKIYQNDSFYLFRISDLINITNSSLSNTEYFFVKPLAIKNPYNNVEFNQSALYYIYYSIKASTFIMPQLFHYYFLSGFNSHVFTERHEYLIRDLAIKKAVYQGNELELHQNVLIMLNGYVPFFKIHPDFPKKRLIEIMRPYLLLYYKYRYSLETFESCKKHLRELCDNLKSFYQFNDQFGRKHIHVTKQLHPITGKPEYIQHVTFNEDHPVY